MIINTFRTYEENHTDGIVYVNGKYFGVSLEDVGRPAGIKHPGETCIPEGTYKVAITHSPKFNRKMIVLYNVDNNHGIDRLGVRFTGVRVHGGNSVEHTAGCPMVAANTDRKGKIWGSLEKEITKLVQAELDTNRAVFWVITQKP